MRRIVLAFTTAAAVAFASTSVAAAQEITENTGSSGENTQAESSQQDGEEFKLENSSYVEFLSSNTEDTTEEPGFNRFLAVLLDTAIGLAALLVVGGIYGELTKLLPLG